MAPGADTQSPCISIVVVQPTPFCNIDCRYCYLPGRSDKAVMTPQTVRTLFERVFTSGWYGEQLTVIWHAGEPLVMPVGFYEQAFSDIEALRPPQLKVQHSLQTNGTLISPQWCALFRKWQVGVGVSIDGPRRFNDEHRLSRGGRSTFDRALAGIRLLRREQIPFHVISVLTESSLQAPQEMLEFYQSEGIEDVCFNVEESEGAHVSGLFASGEPQQHFREFLRSFWQAARAGGQIRLIREIDGMLPRIFRPSEEQVRNVQVEPFAMLNVDVHGNVSTFSPELLGLKNPGYGDYLIGNILSQSLADMRASGTLAAMARDIGAGVERCRRECEYFSVCGGGAPVNKLTENGSFASTRTAFCALT
ncbi:MAG TPA: cyclophane-forming radical SAM/SPASM peptide maturase GrrM/OscB, partial [Steroidobacteraceae bacterium]|nr:cyclophane-forming radical SAM/SPASM peptide maturase GrrM/OscB [Steroidobacteraceae bacterium]